MKKILQVCAIDGSAGSLLRPLIEASMEAGYTVHTACSDTGNMQTLRAQGLDLKEVPIARKISPWSNLLSVWHLYRLMRRERYDIVHVHTPVAALLGRVAAKLARVPHVIYTAHGFYFHEGMSKRTYSFFYTLEKMFARFATDWLLLQSREDYELCLRDAFMKDKNRTIHLSNGTDIWTKFHPDQVTPQTQDRLRAEFGIEKDDLVFAFIGRLVAEKGIFELLEAFNRLRQTHANAKLLVIGEGNKSERDTESGQRLERLLHEDGVIATGLRKDVPELLSLCETFVLPSWREGLPRSIIEAMAMGKAIIASNIRGCREEVFPGENGYLHEKGDADDLFEKMMRLAGDADLRRRYGQRSREICEQYFDEQKVLQTQLNLFDALCDVRQGGQAHVGKTTV